MRAGFVPRVSEHRMKIKPLSRRRVAILGAIAVLSLVVVVASQDGSTIVSASQVFVLRTGASRASLPVRLKIPEIGVDAAVEYVGLTLDGAMGAPKGRTDVAWFNQGPRPGEKGSAVIDGHEGWKNDLPAVFDNLNQLKTGDEILVQDEAGAVKTFVVRDIKTFDKSGNAASVFASSDGKSHLNLITCEGVWNAALKSYSNRLIVFADLK